MNAQVNSIHPYPAPPHQCFQIYGDHIADEIQAEYNSHLQSLMSLPDRLATIASPPFRYLDLPLEIIEHIYIISHNLNLPSTNRLLYISLTRQGVCIRLYASIFSQPLHHKNPYPPADDRNKQPLRFREDLANLQTIMAQQQWFTSAFARQLEDLVPLLQDLAAHSKRDDEARRLSMDWWADTGGRYREGYWVLPRIPNRLLRGRWTREKVELFHRLRSWYMEPHLSGNNRVLSEAETQASDDGEYLLARELAWYRFASCEVPFYASSFTNFEDLKASRSWPMSKLTYLGGAFDPDKSYEVFKMRMAVS